jgi:hypothetical protein
VDVEGFSMREVASSTGTKLGHINVFCVKNELLETLIRDEFDSNMAVARAITSNRLQSGIGVGRDGSGCWWINGIPEGRCLCAHVWRFHKLDFVH